MRKMTLQMQMLLDNYRESCNKLTERIEELNLKLKEELQPDKCTELENRRRLLREERLDLLRAMESMEGYSK